MAFGPQALLRPLLELEEEEGVLLNTSEGLANSGRHGSGPYYLEPLPAELFLGRLDGASLRFPSLFLWKYLPLDIIYGYIDEVLMTNPCQWGRGA